MRAVSLVSMIVAVALSSSGRAQSRQSQPPVPNEQTAPTPQLMVSPTIQILKGLTVPQFDDQMKGFVQALGVAGCQYCHVRGNFASDEIPNKVTARRMLEMTRAINQQYFPDYKPGPEESVLGEVTCYTCHQGSEHPAKINPGN